MTAQDEIGYLDGRQPIEAAKRKGEENSLSRNGRHCRRGAAPRCHSGRLNHSVALRATKITRRIPVYRIAE